MDKRAILLLFMFTFTTWIYGYENYSDFNIQIKNELQGSIIIKKSKKYVNDDVKDWRHMDIATNNTKIYPEKAAYIHFICELNEATLQNGYKLFMTGQAFVDVYTINNKGKEEQIGSIELDAVKSWKEDSGHRHLWLDASFINMANEAFPLRLEGDDGPVMMVTKGNYKPYHDTDTGKPRVVNLILSKDKLSSDPHGDVIVIEKGETLKYTNNTFCNKKILNYGILELDKCKFENDLPTEKTPDGMKIRKEFREKGGSIYNEGSIIIKQTNFIRCYAGEGGAIYNSDIGEIDLSGCMFKSCKALNGNGGAIYNHGTIKYDGLTFIECSSEKIRGKNGGAIYSPNSEVLLDGPIFFKNCRAERGGAIYAKNITFRNIKNLGYDVDNAFDNCYARSKGGAIYTENDVFFSNIDAEISFMNCTSSAEGGAIYACNQVSSNNVYNNQTVHFSNCCASQIGLGGAIYTGTINANNFSFENCSADSGGAVFSRQYSLFDDCKFTENKAVLGGAIYNVNSKLDLINCEFIDNGLLIDVRSGGMIKSKGSALYCKSYKATDCIFSGNEDSEIIGDKL